MKKLGGQSWEGVSAAGDTLPKCNQVQGVFCNWHLHKRSFFNQCFKHRMAFNENIPVCMRDSQCSGSDRYTCLSESGLESCCYHTRKKVLKTSKQTQVPTLCCPIKDPSQIIQSKKLLVETEYLLVKGVLDFIRAGHWKIGRFKSLFIQRRNMFVELEEGNCLITFCRDVCMQRSIDRIISNGSKVWTQNKYKWDPKITWQHFLLNLTCSSECSQLVLIVQTA